MRATLYGFTFSHPVQCCMAMLRHKGVEFRFVGIPPGVHPAILRARGFSRPTVPALLLDGRRLQGTIDISQELDRLVPSPPLHPSPQATEAERWAERELQPTPRHLFRWGLAGNGSLRTLLARIVGVPGPAAPVGGLLSWPLAYGFARTTGATEAQVRADLAALPGRLDRADALVADGVVGGPAANAGDFQLGSCLRALSAFDDLQPYVEGRPAVGLLRHFSEQEERIPRFLPPEWLP